ncbi:transposase, partial [Kozakia baliensis]|uniref:transposase n=1 Tax=Kozakia baliensis TaxID=153496 RepID=UPI0022318A3C
MSKPKPTRYRTTNWSSYNAALKKRGYLAVWFDPSMNWEGLPTRRRGRRQSDSDAAIQTCLTLKV